MSKSDSVDNHVLYAVWHPTKGWLFRWTYSPSFQSKPRFYHNARYAKALAKRAKAQLIAFDVTPTVRSWPSEEG